MNIHEQYTAPCSVTYTSRYETWTDGVSYSSFVTALVCLDPHGPWAQWTSRPIGETGDRVRSMIHEEQPMTHIFMWGDNVEAWIKAIDRATGDSF